MRQREHSSALLVRLARGVGVAAVVATTLLALYSVPQRTTLLQEVCTGDTCAPGQLTPGTAEALERNGISVTGYAWWTFALDVAAVAAYLIMASILLTRRGNERMALIVSIFFCGLALDTYPLPTLAVDGETWSTLAELNWSISVSFGVVFFGATFPTGRIVPRWARWVILYGLLEEISRFLAPGLPINPNSWSESAQGLHLLVWIGLIIGFMVYRYRRVSNQIERQQTKWVVYAVIITLAANILVIAITQIAPGSGSGRGLLEVAAATILDISLLLTPIAISLAIMKHRLFDIDRLIRRTVAYGLLITLLAGLYIGLVTALGVIATGGEGSPLVIAASTLVVAAAFQPLRRRTKNLVDRRFDRRRYDALRIADDFTSRLSGETSLENLRADFSEVVIETMRPSSLSVWFSGADVSQPTDVDSRDADSPGT